MSVTPAYEEVFSHFYVAENNSDETITQTLLPSYQTILVFNFGANVLLYSKLNTCIEVNKCLVLGPIKQSFSYSLPPQSEILVANFKEDAFYRFFGKAAGAENLPIDPDDLLDENCFTALWSVLNRMTDTKSRVDHIYCCPVKRINAHLLLYLYRQVLSQTSVFVAQALGGK